MTNQPEIHDGEWLVLQIKALDGCERTKDQVLSILRGMAGRRVSLHHRQLVIPARVRRAVELLDAGRDTVQVRDALINGGLCASRQTANRTIHAALAERCRRNAESLMSSADQFTAVVTRNSLTGDDD